MKNSFFLTVLGAFLIYSFPVSAALSDSYDASSSCQSEQDCFTRRKVIKKKKRCNQSNQDCNWSINNQQIPPRYKRLMRKRHKQEKRTFRASYCPIL